MPNRRTILNLLILILLSYSSLASARYIQADPIGLEGGVNPYAYVEDNPLSYVDRTGQAPERPGAWPTMQGGGVGYMGGNNGGYIPSARQLPYYPIPARGLPPSNIKPPVKCVEGPASRPSEVAQGGRSLWDERGGEWRYYPGNQQHNPHWDYNAHTPANPSWTNIPIGGMPVYKPGYGPQQ